MSFSTIGQSRQSLSSKNEDCLRMAAEVSVDEEGIALALNNLTKSSLMLFVAKSPKRVSD